MLQLLGELDQKKTDFNTIGEDIRRLRNDNALLKIENDDFKAQVGGAQPRNFPVCGSDISALPLSILA